jgi:para-nitrobenzyl esterase
MTDPAIVVETMSGPIRGEAIGDVRVFRGVPYAAPPVGLLRWRPPVAPPPWTGVRDATRFGDDCPQRTALPIGSRAPGQSEDCLTLNIWTPAQDASERLPVTVWIFGGSFVFGSAAEERADGLPFARDGVLHVTVNYRVGMFGFLAHPALTAESGDGTSGNYGLLDQIAALRWVRDNIARFGGDPARVTLFGVSAGAASIGLLMTSPLAQGLFSQVILQSPGSFRPLATLADAEAAGAGLDPDIDALRALPPAALLDLQKKLEPALRSLTRPRILRPICDGHVVPADDSVSFLAGRFAHVPVILGSMADEGSNAVAAWPVRTVDDYRALLAADFGASADEAADTYAVETDDDVPAQLGELFGDTQFTYGVDALTQVFARAGIPTWRYVFTRHRPGKGLPRHSEDVSYVFDRPDLPPRGETAHSFDAADIALAAAIHGGWVRFARDGDPGDMNGVAWPRFDPDAPAIMEFGDEPALRSDWREPRIAFLRAFFSPDPENRDPSC